MSTPTGQAYSELQHTYDVFNTRLFAGQLPPCLITIQRKNRTYGYFSGERWNDQARAVTDEIALNPMHFATRSTEEVLSTLVHAMVHLWQHHWGTPSRSTYEGQPTQDTDAPLVRLVGHFKNTRAKGPARVFSQRLIETSGYAWYHGDLPVWGRPSEPI